MQNKINKQKGYTIIETMIAISLFIIIVMAGMTALLNANLLHKKSQSMREVMDNLSFIMEDMSRNMRVGYNYDCISNGAVPSDSIATSGQNCGGIAFESTSNNTITTWVYYKGINPNDSSQLSIFKVVDGSTPVQLTPDEVVIDPATSFSVVGAEPPSTGDIQQPFVTIKLVGKITFKNVETPFSLQTSVSQRVIDIDI